MSAPVAVPRLAPTGSMRSRRYVPLAVLRTIRPSFAPPSMFATRTWSERLISPAAEVKRRVNVAAPRAPCES